MNPLSIISSRKKVGAYCDLPNLQKCVLGMTNNALEDAQGEARLHNLDLDTIKEITWKKQISKDILRY